MNNEKKTYHLFQTKDGSMTLFSDQFGEHLHSQNGAFTESMHIFINNGLKLAERKNKEKNTLNIFEMGLGTGLNAFLTLINAEKAVNYCGIDAFPLKKGDLLFSVKQSLEKSISEEVLNNYDKIFEATWNEKVKINERFCLKKIESKIENYEHEAKYDVVYFDAFSPDTQPELWAEKIFEKLFDAMNSNAVMATYCAKGIVRRIWQSLGFEVHRLPGPPGKREILVAVKP